MRTRIKIRQLKRLHKKLMSEYYLIKNIQKEAPWASALLNSATHIKSKYNRLEESLRRYY